ncbi:hypothetical protein Nmel_008333 [Mimus melanotis]
MDSSYFVWEKNGQKMKACITERSHKLLDGRVHVFSWVKDAVSENTEYRCSFISKVGNTMSQVLITVEDKDSAGQDAWTKEFDTWKSAISDHDKMMQNWKKTWTNWTAETTGFHKRYYVLAAHRTVSIGDLQQEKQPLMDKGMNRLEGEMCELRVRFTLNIAFGDVFASVSNDIKTDIKENHLKHEVKGDILPAPKNS